MFNLRPTWAARPQTAVRWVSVMVTEMQKANAIAVQAGCRGAETHPGLGELLLGEESGFENQRKRRPSCHPSPQNASIYVGCQELHRRLRHMFPCVRFTRRPPSAVAFSGCNLPSTSSGGGFVARQTSAGPWSQPSRAHRLGCLPAARQAQDPQAAPAADRRTMSNHHVLKPSASGSLSRQDDFRITGPNLTMDEVRPQLGCPATFEGFTAPPPPAAAPLAPLKPLTPLPTHLCSANPCRCPPL